MVWYRVPIFADGWQDAAGNVGTTYSVGQGLPGKIEPAAEQDTVNGVLHAHAPKSAPTTALLGLTWEHPLPLPPGWVRLTTEEAMDHFVDVTGRVSLPAEIPRVSEEVRQREQVVVEKQRVVVGEAAAPAEAVAPSRGG